MSEEVYIPIQISHPSEAVRSLLSMTLKHMADFQVMMLQIIAEKYEIPEDDLITVVQDHPKYKEMLVNPMLYALQAAGVDVSEKKVDESKAVPTVTVKCADGSTKKIPKKKVGGGVKPVASAAP